MEGRGRASFGELIGLFVIVPCDPQRRGRRENER